MFHASKDNEGTVSIIVPVYGVERTLRKCLDSILDQDYVNLDIILIDDGSPDNCGSICDEYANADHRVRVFHTPNRGLSAARNYGLDQAAEAGSPYVGFVDPDDFVEPSMYGVLVAEISATGADVAQCGFWRDGTDCGSFDAVDRVYSGGEVLAAYLDGEITHHVWNKIYHSELFERLRFPEGRVYEDMSIAYPLLSQCRSVASISVRCYHYVFQEGSITESRAVSNLLDFWRAQRDRFACFSRNDVRFKYGKAGRNWRTQIALAVTKVWRWALASGLSEINSRKTDFREITAYCRAEFPLFGERDWPLHARMGVVLARCGGMWSLAVCYCLNRIAMWLVALRNPIK